MNNKQKLPLKFGSRFDTLRRISAGSGGGYDPCTMTYATTYFNRPDVQETLHANVTKVPYSWRLCNANVSNAWTDWAFSILPIIQKLVDGDLRVWIYSGDADGRVPVTSKRYTLDKLGLNITEDWTPRYNHREVGGWSVEYEGLTFLTVRGAGHKVLSRSSDTFWLTIGCHLSHFDISSDLLFPT